MKKHSKKLILTLLIYCITFICSISILTANQKVYAASKVKLNKSKVTVYIGKTCNLKVAGTKKQVKWSSSDKKIATVNSKGKVTGKKVGTATITAKVEKKSLKCKVNVKSVLSTNKTSVKISSGKESKVKITLKKKGIVSYKIKNPNIVSCSWGKWSKDTRPLTIRAKSNGSTTITISNSYNKEKVKIKVTISNPWNNVKVIIPKTVGEQSAPSNRMKIMKYSFYNATYSGASYYYMNYQYKLVEYGKTSRSNWGEYFYCYDKNGNILKKCYMYASSLALNRTYADDTMIPLETAKIVFMEYPDIVNESATTEENVSKLVRYIISNGSVNKGYKYISNTYTSGRNTITSTITYRNDIDRLIFHSACNNNTYVSFDYDIETLSSHSDLDFSYINTATIQAYAPFDISAYTYDTNLEFDITMAILTSNTEEEIQEFANQHARLAVSAWGLLIAKKAGLSLSDIGFTLYDSN